MAVKSLGTYLNALKNTANNTTKAEDEEEKIVQELINEMASRQESAVTTPTVTTPTVTTPSAPTPTTPSAPNSATSFAKNEDQTYKQMLSDSLNNILNNKSFSYDVENDPAYSAYKKQYLREGERAANEVLSDAALMTGGTPSSYAVSAATQAGNRYAGELSDIIPTLYNDAYNRYLTDLNRKITEYGLIKDAEQEEWNRRYDLANKFAAQGNNTYLNLLLEELGLKEAANNMTDTPTNSSTTLTTFPNSKLENMGMTTPIGSNSNGWFQENPITFAVSEEDKLKAALEEEERKAAEQKMINDILIAEAELTIARQQEAKRQEELARQQAQEANRQKELAQQQAQKANQQTQSTNQNKGTTGTVAPYRAGQEPEMEFDPYASLNENSTMEDLRNAGYAAAENNSFAKEGLPGYDMESEHELELMQKLDAALNEQAQTLGLGDISHDEFSELVNLGVIDLIDDGNGSLTPKLDIKAQYFYNKGMFGDLAKYTAQKRA